MSETMPEEVTVMPLAVHVLSLRPGDVLIVRLPERRITRAVFEQIRDQLRETLDNAGMENQVIVVDEQIELSVLTTQGAET